MTRIAFLGLGAMGARMAARLIGAGHGVTVWNRTPERAAPLVAMGAALAASPRAAASGAEVVIAMLRDDAASAAVWLDPETGAFAGMGAGSLGIEASTLTPAHVRALHQAAGGAGFIDAPLAGSRPQAEAGQLIFMAGGAADLVARAEPVLLAMGGAVHHAGAAGAGAGAKLMVNALFAAQVAVMAELIGLARRLGLDPARAMEIIGATPVASPALKGAAAAMLARSFAPAFPISLVAKDMAMTMTTARAVSADLPLTAATLGAYEGAVASGFGESNITGILQRYT